MIDAKLIKNVISMAAFQAGNYIVPLITFPFLTRVLGPRQYGFYGLAFAIAGYLFLTVDWGFGWSASAAIARAGNDRAKIRIIFWNTLCAKSILLLGVYISMIFCAVTGIIGLELLPVLICASAIIIGNVFSLDWYLQGREELGRLVWPSMICKFATVPLTFALVSGPSDAWLAAGIQAAASIASGVFSQLMVALRHEVDRPLRGDIRPLPYIRRGWPYFAAAAAPTLYTTANTILLGVMAGPVAVGTFAVADRLRSAAQAVLAPISKAAYPRSVRLTHERDPALRKFILLVLIAEFSIAGTISVFLFTFNHEIMQLVAGSKFQGSADVLAILAFGPLLVGMSDVLGMQVMLPRNMNKQFARIRWCAGAVNIAVVVILIPKFMAVGAALGTVIAELCILVMMAVAIKAIGPGDRLVHTEGADNGM